MRFLLLAVAIGCVNYLGGAGCGLAADTAGVPDEPDVAGILEKLRKGDPEGRLGALDELRQAAIHNQFGELKLEAIELCVRLMQDGDAEVANRACDVLTWADADAAPLLIDALQSENQDAQSRAARALSSIASRDRSRLGELDGAIPHLAKLMGGEKNVARHNAIYALAQMGPHAIPHMIDGLAVEDYFQQVLMRGFIRHGEKAIGPLCGALGSRDVTTRRNAAWMLFGISWKNPDMLPVLQKVALGPLTEGIGDDDPLVRERVIDALGRMGELAKPSLGRIIGALDQPDAPFHSIADAANRIGVETKHIDALFEGVARSNQDQAVGIFGRAIGSVGESGLGRIAFALGDPREIVRQTALHALFAMGPKAAPAVPDVIRRLIEGDRMASQVLAAIGPGAADSIPHLIRMMEHDDWYRPRRIVPEHFPIHYSIHADALSEIGSAAVPALMDGLKSDSELVKAGCLVALAKMGEDGKIPLAKLEPLCRDKHLVVRGLAFQGVLRWAGESRSDVSEFLARLAGDRDPGVAGAATIHLKNLNPPER